VDFLFWVVDGTLGLSHLGKTINLARFPNLRIFRFGFASAAYPDDLHNDPIPWLLQSLTNIKLAVGDGNSELEEITLDFGQAVTDFDAERPFRLSSHEVLMDLDSLLTTSTQFRNLRRFNIDIWGADENACGAFLNSLPLLAKKGLLHVQEWRRFSVRYQDTRKTQLSEWNARG